MAQGPPPYPEVILADLPNPMADGSYYHICGTSTLPDNTVITITVANSWFHNMYDAGSYNTTTSATVSGGAFCTATAYLFNGYGGYAVSAAGGTTVDYESGIVSSP